MPQENTGVDYSEIHRIDRSADRILRADMWSPGEDLGQHSFATTRYFDFMVQRLGMVGGTHVLDLRSGTGGPTTCMAAAAGCRMAEVEVNEVGG